VGAFAVWGQVPSTPGWYPLANTKLRSVCPNPIPAGVEGCAAVTEDWSGGAFDSQRNRLLMWGGGHRGYSGNELYALNVDTLSIARLTDPTPAGSIRDGCTSGGTYADGLPVSRHSYNHLAYLPVQDALFGWGGSMWQCGFMAGDLWWFRFQNQTWEPKAVTGGPTTNFGRSAAYDPVTNLVYMRDDFNLFSYDPVTNQWAKRTTVETGQSNGDYKTAVIDPVGRRYFYYIPGNATLYWYDISSATAATSLQSGSTTNCGFMSTYGAGWEYDSIQNRLVGWANGDSVYVMDPQTRVCATVSYSGGPAALGNGTFGRFRYSAKSNLFVVCNDVDVDCHALRLSAAVGDQLAPAPPSGLTAQ
jgi:hypothetical protein